MGDSEITVARNYLEGAGGAFKGIDALPLTGQMTHYSVNKDTGKPDYTPDSAATGTAWATGVKTYDNADLRSTAWARPYPTLLELAKQSGLRHRRRHHLRDPGRHPGRPGQPHQPALLLRPDGDHRQLPRGGQGERRPRLDQRAAARHPPRRHPRRRLGDVRRDRRRPAGGRARRSSSRPRHAATTTSPTRATSPEWRAPTRTKPLLGLFSPGNMPVRFAPLVATPGGADLPAQSCKPEPTFSQVPDAEDDDRARRSTCSRTTRPARRRASSCRSRAPRSTRRTTPPTPAARSVRPSSSTRPSRRRWTFAKKDGNTLVIVDRRPRAHQPDRRRQHPRPDGQAGHHRGLGDDRRLRHLGRRWQPAAHGHAGARRGLRPRRGQRGRADRPDRPALPDRRARPSADPLHPRRPRSPTAPGGRGRRTLTPGVRRPRRCWSRPRSAGG